MTLTPDDLDWTIALGGQTRVAVDAVEAARVVAAAWEAVRE